MLKGEFKKPNRLFCIILIICGVFMISLGIFIKFTDSTASENVNTLIYIGIPEIVLGVFYTLFNYRPYITLNDGQIKARFGFF